MVSRKKGSATAEPYRLAVRLFWAAISLSFAVVIAAAFLPEIWASFPNTQDTRFTNGLALISATVGLGGMAFAIYSFRASAEAARLQQKKQHTITILFESRLSPELREANTTRKAVFPVGTDISYEVWNNAYRRLNLPPNAKPEEADRQNAAAEALVTLLNYYEFLALGIKLDDLDPDLLKGSIRGLMCNLVDDARFVIAHLRAINGKTYENLAELYDDWRDPTARDTQGVLSEREIPAVPAPAH